MKLLQLIHVRLMITFLFLLNFVFSFGFNHCIVVSFSQASVYLLPVNSQTLLQSSKDPFKIFSHLTYSTSFSPIVLETSFLESRQGPPQCVGWVAVRDRCPPAILGYALPIILDTAPVSLQQVPLFLGSSVYWLFG